MPIHDWSRVDAGIFHDFHNSWTTHIKETLNDRLLPDPYYALSEQRAGRILPDVVTLRGPGGETAPAESGGVAVAEAPPKVSMTFRPSPYERRQKSVTIRHVSDDRVVAVIEIVSPSNKDREQSVRDFVERAWACLDQGIHVLIIDLIPPTPRDPRGMPGVIWSRYEPSTDPDYALPPEKPLGAASFCSESGGPVIYLEPLAVGMTLPEMPLFFDPGRYVDLPLEETYGAAYKGVPARWRRVIEA